MYNKIITSFNQVDVLNYDKILKEKSLLIFRFIDIPTETYIEKKSNILYINSYKYDIQDRSILEVLDLILEQVKDLEILYFNESIEYVKYTSALFLQDFSTKKFIKTDIIFSPIDLSLFYSHIDYFNNEYELVNTKVYKNRLPVAFNIDGKFLYLEKDISSTYLLNEYSAKELNISLLHEFSVNNVQDTYMYNPNSYLTGDLNDS